MTVLDHERGVPQASGFARLLKCLGWAIFLGISWTWCIGMFLPVLLVRDYGVWGWVVFAIPNVIGAAAVGWLNRTAEQSVQTVKAHGPMMTAFSAVTATFQIFFTLWILGRLSPSPEDFTKATFAFALIVVSLPLSRSFTYGPLVAIFVLLISIGCMVEGFRSDQLIPIHKILDLLRINPGLPIIPLALSTSFGFLFCPHLDLSFHRVRQYLSTKDSHITFSTGLGIVFAAMIFFSLLYSVSVALALQDLFFANGVLLAALSVYFLVQLAFTMGIHWHADALQDGKGSPVKFFYMTLGTVVAGFFCNFARRFLHSWNFEPGEFIYRLFLSFYGLLFPAYVYLCMIPGRGRLAPSRRQWIVLAVSVLLAAPMFWMAFIERKMFYVLPGLAVVLFARLLIPNPKNRLETR